MAKLLGYSKDLIVDSVEQLIEDNAVFAAIQEGNSPLTITDASLKIAKIIVNQA